MFAKDDRQHKDCKGLTESGALHCRAPCRGGGIASEPDTGSSMARSWASPPTTAEGCTPRPSQAELPRPNFTLRQDAIFPRSSERCRSSPTNLAASCRHATPRVSPRGRYCAHGGCDGTTPSTHHLVRLKPSG